MNRTHFLLSLQFMLSLLLSGCGGGSTAPSPPVASGSISINITGVPAGVDADVLLIAINEQDVNGRSKKWTINRSQTINNLKPQLYMISALTFDKGFIKYEIGFPGDKFLMPTPFVVQVDLAQGQAFDVDIAYKPRDIVPATADIQIDDSILPSGTTIVPMNLVGPHDFSLSIPTSMTVAGLLPGSYSVIGTEFSTQGKNYTDQSMSILGILAEGESKSVFLKVVEVPVWRKSVTPIPLVSITGARDPWGNFFTVENIPTATIYHSTSRHVAHKWDAQGKLLWSTLITQQTYLYWDWNWAADAQGNFYAAGYEDVGVFVGLQLQNFKAQLYKFSPTGKLLWMVNIPGLMGGERARVEQMAVVDNKVIMLSTRVSPTGNTSFPREARVNVVSANDGATVNMVSDSSIGSFRQLQTDATATGIWTFASDRIIHYSANGAVLGVVPIGLPASLVYADVGGGAVYHFDNSGGIFVATTVAGAQDIDVQVSHYLADLSLDWQKVFTNPGKDSIDSAVMGFDPVGGRVLMGFHADGKISGYTGLFHDVLMEYGADGAQHWVRQTYGFGPDLARIEPVPGTQDWVIDAAAIGFNIDSGFRVVIGP